MKKRRIVKKIIDIAIGILVVLFLIVVCLQRFSGNKFSFFNYRMFVVASGSMQPKYKVGDVLISKEVETSKIKVGDVISYQGRQPDVRDKIITHQVVSIEKDKDGNYIFHTKGLSNAIEDPIVYENQVYGVVKYKMFLLSLVYKILGMKFGLLLIIIPIFYIIGSEIILVLLEKEDNRRGKA